MKPKYKEGIDASDSINDKEIIATVKEVVDIKDGLHTGVIDEVGLYSGEFNYIRFGIKPLDVNIPSGVDTPILTVGFPANISIKSSLGKLMLFCGADFTKKKEFTMLDIKKLFYGKKISFQTLTETTEKGTFSSVIKESIKFIS